MKVREFMYETRLGPAFGGEIGDEVVKDCMTDAAVITPNEFFNGVEPNNQEECNCEGECTGDKVCDCEGECDCAGESADRKAKKDKKNKKKRFSFKQMLEGAEQELGDAAEQAQKGEGGNPNSIAG